MCGQFTIIHLNVHKRIFYSIKYLFKVVAFKYNISNGFIFVVVNTSTLCYNMIRENADGNIRWWMASPLRSGCQVT